jgi:hypothetical protein
MRKVEFFNCGKIVVYMYLIFVISYILSTIETRFATTSEQLTGLITELKDRLKNLGYNLPYHLVGEGSQNDKLLFSIVKHALSQALALQRSAHDGEPPLQFEPFKRWLQMSPEEQHRFLSDPNRLTQAQRWLQLSPEQRKNVLDGVIDQAMKIWQTEN